MPCPGVFVEDPEAHLAKLGVELGGAVEPKQTAILATTHRFRVNGQFYWVSSGDNIRRFRESPHRYTGPLRDPVTREWFDPARSSPQRTIQGQILYFKSKRTEREFADNPDRFDVAFPWGGQP